jgi:uncharacterized Zn finger protein (UPF0148 family)
MMEKRICELCGSELRTAQGDEYCPICGELDDKYEKQVNNISEAETMETFEKLPDNHPAKLEIARLQRENEELKRENRQLGELSYVLRMLNVARNALARIVIRPNSDEQIAIAKNAQNLIRSIEKDWAAAYPITTQTVEVETY